MDRSVCQPTSEGCPIIPDGSETTFIVTFDLSALTLPVPVFWDCRLTLGQSWFPLSSSSQLKVDSATVEGQTPLVRGLVPQSRVHRPAEEERNVPYLLLTPQQLSGFLMGSAARLEQHKVTEK